MSEGRQKKERTRERKRNKIEWQTDGNVRTAVEQTKAWERGSAGSPEDTARTTVIGPAARVVKLRG